MELVVGPIDISALGHKGLVELYFNKRAEGEDPSTFEIKFKYAAPVSAIDFAIALDAVTTSVCDLVERKLFERVMRESDTEVN